MHRMSSLDRRAGAPHLPSAIAIGALLAFSLFPPEAALANDSIAHLATGGLVLSRTDAVSMVSEDLFVSTREIRVRYRFVNRTDADVTTLVAFPLPDITAPSEEYDFVIPDPDAAENFLDFETTVDGKPVAMEVEQRALALGIDRTDLLKSLSLPIAPHTAGLAERLAALPEATLRKLAELGMIADHGSALALLMPNRVRPLWLARTTYYWKQTFPAGKDVLVEHRYRPSVGESMLPAIGNAYASKKAIETYTKRYCIDPAFLRAANAMQQREPKSGSLVVTEKRLEYVLKTGANWAGAIRSFHLTVDTGGPENLVSFCMDGVRKVSPTRFEASRENYWPERNLDVLFLVPVALPGQ